MNISIYDLAEEFRIQISGRFADSSVDEVASAWRTALAVNVPRRISVDITAMTSYDRAGYLLLRDIYLHGTHIAAGTPGSLLFLSEISSQKSSAVPAGSSTSKRSSAKVVIDRPSRATASGE